VMSPINTRPISGRPEIRVDLNGSPDGLAKTVDVAALSSWLAMRAIDRETRRLDQLERGASVGPESDDLWDEVLPKADPLPASEVKMPNRDPRRKNSGAKTVQPRLPVVPQAAVPQSPPPDPPTGNVRVQPLPPPINIKPAPGAMQAPRPRSAAPPPASRTF